MLDRSIPFYNIILKCSRYRSGSIVLPHGFSFRKFENGDEKAWAALEYAVGDFASEDEAEQYFVTAYCQNPDDIRERCIFMVNEKDEAVGSCIAWKDWKNNQAVPSLHWLVVLPAYQGRSLGRALCRKTMESFWHKGEFPVYIHTQPWSYKAVFLYIQEGFLLQITDTFSDYQNQYEQAIGVLKEIVTKPQYGILLSHSE